MVTEVKCFRLWEKCRLTEHPGSKTGLEMQTQEVIITTVNVPVKVIHLGTVERKGGVFFFWFVTNLLCSDRSDFFSVMSATMTDTQETKSFLCSV